MCPINFKETSHALRAAGGVRVNETTYCRQVSKRVLAPQTKEVTFLVIIQEHSRGTWLIRPISPWIIYWLPMNLGFPPVLFEPQKKVVCYWLFPRGKSEKHFRMIHTIYAFLLSPIFLKPAAIWTNAHHDSPIFPFIGLGIRPVENWESKIELFFLNNKQYCGETENRMFPLGTPLRSTGVESQVDSVLDWKTFRGFVYFDWKRKVSIADLRGARAIMRNWNEDNEHVNNLLTLWEAWTPDPRHSVGLSLTATPRPLRS